MLNRLLPSACGLVLAALAAAPLFSNPGFLSTRGIGDSPNLLFRVHQLLASLAAGEFPARWMPDAAYGYGLPYFTYYASASTHLAAALKAYGFSYVSALKLTQALALLAGAGGLWGWLRAAGFSRGAAALAAAAYTFAPFHLVNLYIRGDSLAELWAQGLFPWALWAAQRLLEQPTFARAGALADVVALLILTHNISALNFLPLVGLYLALGGWRRARTRWPAAALAVLWGLALTAFFWLPALREGEFVQLGDLTRGYFFYGNHFRGGDLFQWTPLFDYAGQPFSLGLVQTALAAAGLVVWLWRAVAHRRWPAVEVFLVAGLALTTLLITPLSSPLWEHVPLLRYTQFPWRFLAPQALFLAALTGYLAAPAGAEAGWRRWGRIGVSGLGGLALAVSALAGLRLEFIPLTDADVTAERLNVYEYFTTALGNTVNAEYLPSAVRPRPFTSAALLGRAPRLTALSGTAEGERVWRRGAAEEWQVRVAGPEPAVMAFPTFYWPGWEAAIDGQPAPVRAAEGLGWLTVEVPVGAHTVTFRLGRTPLRLGAEIFSLLALSVPAAVYLWRRRRAVSLTPSTAAWRPWLLVSGMGVLGFLVLRLIPSAPPSAAPLSMDFDTLAYPHAAPVRFANGAALTQVAYSATHLPSGATLTVTTHWRAPVTATAVFQIAAPLANFAAPLPSAAAVIYAAPAGGEQTVALALPADLTPGMYFVTVELADKFGVRPAVTDTGRARGRVFLAPFVVDGPARWSAAPASADLGALRVLTGTVGLAGGDTLAARVDWQAVSAAPRNYQAAVRLRDAAGFEWASAEDQQLAAGLYPTALWRPGEAVADYYRLTLAGPGEPPGAYELVVTPYAVDTLQPLGEARLPVTLNRRHPRAGRVAQFALTPSLGLERVEFSTPITQGEALTLTGHWLTGVQPLPVYTARWSLTAADGWRLSWDLPLAASSGPEQWPLDAYVQGRARAPVPDDLPPGDYALSVQLLDAVGQPAGAEARVGSVAVTGRPRVFAVPAYQTEVGATFGDELKLWGYDAARAGDTLELTLVWGALAAPRASYKYFIHIFNPADDVIVAQADAVPRAFTYPTDDWAAGEVVTDTVTLNLAGVPPGVYQVAAGWYDPAAPDLARRPAFAWDGAPQPGERVILPLTVTAP